MELWKDIVGFEGLYEVSSLGRVRSLARMVACCNGYRKVTPKIKSTFINKKGYLRVQLFKDTKKKNVRVHRAVAMAFIPNPENKEEVNHKNFDKTDNSIQNLEWVTSDENLDHFREHSQVEI